MTRRELLRLIGVGTVAGVTGRLCVRPDIVVPSRRRAGAARRRWRRAILPGPSTRVWRFTGEVLKGPPQSLQAIPESYLGPILRLQKGQKVRIRFTNALPEPSIVHWHGMDMPSAMDGHPHSVIDPASRFHLRVRGDEPGRHVLVSPASAQSHRTAGLQRTRRSAARV